MDFLKQFRSAKSVSVPIVVVRCPDHPSVVGRVVAAFPEIPVVWWNCAEGVQGVNELGIEAAEEINKNDPPQSPAITTGNPSDALPRVLESLPRGGIAFFSNLHLLLETIDPGPRLAVTQGIANVRDKFKSTGRMLVLLCPDIRLPAELMNDVIILDVPLPDREELGNVVAGTHVAAQVKVPEQDGLSRAVDALCGLSRFTAEQVTAMSLRKAGLDLEEMWDRKRTIIQQVGGLQVEKRRVRFDDLGGLFQVKEFARLIINGKRRPKLVVLVDEIDRQLSGINDSSGVGGDAYQQLLSNLQDRGWQGILFPGFGGTGKTELGNAIGTEAGGLFLKFDMGGMQDKFVGESQRKVRAAMEMLWAMGGEDVLFVGTTNNAQAIRPELLRRFNLGQWFYDLPTAEEQAPIWDIYLKRFEVPEQEKPECHEWTGAEIRKVCELSWMLGVSLKEASRFITPICKSMGDQVKAMREQASGKYLSASGGGLYKVKKTGVSVDTIRQFTKPASGSN